MVGVSAKKSTIHAVNVQGSLTYMPFADILFGMDACFVEMVRRQAAGKPSLKMVISMSLGGICDRFGWGVKGQAVRTLFGNKPGEEWWSTHYGSYMAAVDKLFDKVSKRGDNLIVAAAG